MLCKVVQVVLAEEVDTFTLLLAVLELPIKDTTAALEKTLEVTNVVVEVEALVALALTPQARVEMAVRVLLLQSQVQA